MLADGRTERREFRDQLRRNKDFSLTLNAYKPFQIGKLGTNTVNVGAEYSGRIFSFALRPRAA
ncbi:MAG: hypothetical protein ACR2N3_03190 [Pyrinomonadaceae bacterium]